MTPTLFLVFNHSFTLDQEQDALTSLGVGRIISLPADLREPGEISRLSWRRLRAISNQFNRGYPI